MESTSQSLNNLQYPIGTFAPPTVITPSQIETGIATIQAFPRDLQEAVTSLSTDQLQTPYRPGGWTVAQLVHHCADSHINSYCRFKLALTEDKPIIKPYEEALWAELADTKESPVEVSLHLLMALHFRWTVLLKSLGSQELRRTFIHPAKGKEVELQEVIIHYAWHCQHHLAHINKLKEREGW